MTLYDRLYTSRLHLPFFCFFYLRMPDYISRTLNQGVQDHAGPAQTLRKVVQDQVVQRRIATLSCTSPHQISLQTHNAKPVHCRIDQLSFRPYGRCRASDAKGMKMDLECRWGKQHHQERTHRSSGDTMGTGSYQRCFPSRPSEAGDRLRSNVEHATQVST